MSDFTLMNGDQIVWVVFDNDGCECSNFIGVFATQGAAEKIAERIRAGYSGHYATQYPDRKFEWMGSVSVDQRFMGSFYLPPDVEHYESGGSL